jgi:alkanesulfonate monooxygenase SsuD/methylene tetrahydromethanopterin reductase-like flavin-dependent oxidoreductase (luciferase family)
LITLATVAGATCQIRLMSMILIAPLRNPQILAKQAATLDALSNGRLMLGLGLGAREDDYRAAAVPFAQRGRQLEAQLAVMQRIWSGQATDESLGPIGPTPVQPGGPEVLLGAYTPAGIQRVGQWANGFIFGGATDPRMRPQIILSALPRLLGDTKFARLLTHDALRFTHHEA